MIVKRLRGWLARHLIARQRQRHYKPLVEGLEVRHLPSISIAIPTYSLKTLAFLSLDGQDAALPSGPLLEDSNGDLFGTTFFGGTSHCGTVFELPAGGSTIDVLASFDNANGAYPTCGLVEDSSGDFFGTSAKGGPYGAGTVFELPHGSSSIIALATFNGTTTGGNPNNGIVLDSLGNLFGTTWSGGLNNGGLVFKVQISNGSMTTLASFDTSDGHPNGLVEDGNGDLFGVTRGGTVDAGSVFEVQPLSGTVTRLIYFDTYDQYGSFPNSLYVDSRGDLFGTTLWGGVGQNGTVFKVQQSAGTGTITTLANFNGFNGNATFSNPNGSAEYDHALIEDGNGDLFGTTEYGGIGFTGLQPQSGDGTVFEVASGSTTITNLTQFDFSDGAYPAGGLIQDPSGAFFGASGGGPQGAGTIFTLEPSLGAWTLGQPGFGQTLSARGGTGSLTFTTPTNSLPPGLTLSTAGVFSGTPTQAGSFHFTVAANDSTGAQASQPFLITVNPAVSLTTLSLPTWTTGQGFSQTISASGGTGSLTFSSSGMLPLGLTLNGSTGVLSGTPTTPGNYSFMVTASDSVGSTDTKAFTLAINPTVMIEATNLPVGLTGLAYSQTINASGGTGPLTFSVASPGLPPGLTLSKGGVLSGMPTVTGSYTFTISVSDSLGSTNTRSFALTINSALTFTTTSLTTGGIDMPYSQTISVTGGIGGLTFSLPAASLPAGVTMSNSGMLSGTPTSAGSFNITVTAVDARGATGSQTFILAIKVTLLVSVVGPSTVQAGSSFVVLVQAADAQGNPITHYSSGPAFTATLSPGAGSSTFPSTVSIGSNGLGLLLATIQRTGTYTITVADSTGTSSATTPSLTVTGWGPATKLGFVSQPVSVGTGIAQPPITVQIQDQYGNLVSNDNSDVVTLFIASGPPSSKFLSGSTLTVTATNGVATFNNLTLVVPGTYTLGAVVPGMYTGPNSNAFKIAPLQVVPGSFTPTSTGFSVSFNAPFLANSTTPILYGTGYGLASGQNGQPPTVILTSDSSNLYDTNAYVQGTVLLNPPTDAGVPGLTFIATDTASAVNNGTPILPDGVYTAIIRGTDFPSPNGLFYNPLRALHSGGGSLDGKGTGVPGSGDFTATFTVGAAAAGDDVVWVPATADGPLQPLTAPGNNQQTLFQGGLPVYLDDASGTVTSVTGTFTYNPGLLNVTGGTSNSSLPGSSFTLTVTTPGTATFTYTDSGTNEQQLTGGLGSKNALIPGGYLSISAPALGFINATVPNSSIAAPIYKAKDLLTLSNVQINGGATLVIGSSAVHLVAYVGDADGNGAYSATDAVLMTRVLVSTDSGFAAYPLLDPTILADTDGYGFIAGDGPLQVNEAGVGFPTNSLAIPQIPGGADTTPIGNNVDPSLSVGRAAWSVGPDGQLNVTVPVNIDNAHPTGSTGLIRGHLALAYDPGVFTVSAADVHPGSLLAGGGWTIAPTIDPSTGQIVIALSSDTPITSTQAGSLVIIDLHVRSGEPRRAADCPGRVGNAVRATGQHRTGRHAGRL